MTSASSNSIYCERPPAYRVLRLAGPCILFSAHNYFFHMHINNGLPSEEGKGFLSNESKSKQGRDPTQSVQGGIVLSSSKKMRVSVSSSCNTGTPNAAVGRICSRRRFLLNLCRYAWRLVRIVAQAQGWNSRTRMRDNNSSHLHEKSQRAQDLLQCTCYRCPNPENNGLLSGS